MGTEDFGSFTLEFRLVYCESCLSNRETDEVH